MYSTKTMSFILGVLALSASSKAWEIKFLADDSCVTDHYDTMRNGKSGESDECDPLISDIKTAVIKDWDDNCRLLLWGADEFIDCGMDLDGGKAFFNMSLAEAKKDGEVIFDEKTGRACLRHQIDEYPLLYLSYLCS